MISQDHLGRELGGLRGPGWPPRCPPGGLGFPVDQANLGNTNANCNKPYWVLVDSALQALETGVTVGNSVFIHGLVVDTRVYAPIADLAPALVGDSGAPSMQHMAVVRDFALPSAPPQASMQVTAPNGP